MRAKYAELGWQLLSEQLLSTLKTGKVKAVWLLTLEAINKVLDCYSANILEYCQVD